MFWELEKLKSMTLNGAFLRQLKIYFGSWDCGEGFEIRTLTGAGNDSLEVGTVQKLLTLTGAY